MDSLVSTKNKGEIQHKPFPIWNTKQANYNNSGEDLNKPDKHDFLTQLTRMLLSEFL